MAERILLRALRDVCRENDIVFHTFADGWVVRLEQNGRARHVHGYDFGLNPADATLLARDKAAAADIFRHAGVPHIEHAFFPHPGLAALPDLTERLSVCFDRMGRDVVVKPNDDTGGQDVNRVRNRRDLVRHVRRVFRRNRSAAVSPYRGIASEYRVVLLDGVPLLVYAKERRSVTGDGRRTLRELAVASGFSLPDDHETPDEIVPAGERPLLDWRHNLGRGAIPVSVDPARPDIERLARRAAEALGLRFASVDVAESNAGLEIVEANSGVMMEALAGAWPDGFERATAVYRAAVKALFAL